MQIKEITQETIAPAKPPTADQQRVKSLQTKIEADRLAFPRSSRHVLLSTMNRRNRNEENSIYGRV